MTNKDGISVEGLVERLRDADNLEGVDDVLVLTDEAALALEAQERAYLALSERVGELERIAFMVAPSHQGGHSATGGEIAEALGVPFPLSMDDLRPAAIERCFMPYDLWPWLQKLDEDRAALSHKGMDQ